MKRYLSLALAALTFSGIVFAEDQKPVGTYYARQKEVMATVRAARSKGDGEYAAEIEKQFRALTTEFPDKVDSYRLMVMLTESLEPDREREVLKAFNHENVVAGGRSEVRARLGRLDQLGKPFEMKFTALDGRDVDIAAMKGKVVLVDFWATWCGGCVQELPNVKAVYEKLHAKGFEVIGVSFDDDKSKLEGYVAEKQLPWPEYYSEKGWKSDFRRKYFITGIPEMWLINKKGELVDLQARKGLEERVEKLLAE